jgi:hypothetical protein
MSAPITVQFDAVTALADELSLLATRLAEESPLCRVAGASLRAALGNGAGDTAAAAATAWGGLAEVLAEECAATARTLADAVAAYRALDAELARELLPGTIGGVPVPR